jgi:hypothetical protein
VSITGLSTTATGTVLTLSDTAQTSSVNLILQNQKEIRFSETTANGTNYVGFKAPASLSADKIWILPTADGTAGQFLKTDGAGNLSFDSLSFSTPLAVIGNATAGSEIRLPEDTDNGSNYVAIKAPDTLASNLTLTLPSADGTSGQVLQTNGSGVLSFSSPSSDFVKLATTTLNGTASSISIDGYFSSTYKVYQVHVTNYYGASVQTLRLRYRRSSADIATSSYTYAQTSAYRSVGAGGASGGSGWNVAQIHLDEDNMSTSSALLSNGVITFFDPANTSSNKYVMYNFVSSPTTGDEVARTNGFGLLKDGTTTALSGFTLFGSASANLYITVDIYGYK